MKRYLCIHGHFYQPPRENPWLEEVEVQDSAYPFHDWNERITAECYEPNTASRLLDDRGRITGIVNNYTRVSFNFGPTLLSWLERHAPETYQMILDADRASLERFEGHGAALAQAYNHLIMPLANDRDKRTQVRWGIGDFVHRFGRRPEGMWLPETAVDLASLEALAAEGILFTILAPYQARRYRRIGEEAWNEVGEGGIDPRRPYLCRLPSGREISLFFYDGPIARDIAFGDLLRSGERFADRLREGFGEFGNQLVHVATDGETYGHHHRFGDMALAHCLEQIDSRPDIALTLYGRHLELHPPEFEVEILENSSWSCAHGVERWRSDCGCRIGGPGWSQEWREPLRQSLDWLRDRLSALYEEEGGKLFNEPWSARDDYIEVILDRSPGRIGSFLNRHCGRDVEGEERTQALRLLELQRQAQLMYTSCGWFFDEISGMEAVQILGYASRALQLALETSGQDLEPEFLALLEKAPSNLEKWGNGRRIYEGLVRPWRLDLIRVAAHQAIAREYEEPQERSAIYCYSIKTLAYEQSRSGRLGLGTGRLRIRSEITGNQGDFTFAVLHFGGHNVSAGIRPFRDEETCGAMSAEIRRAFRENDIPEVVRLMDRHFGTHTYTLSHLFKDEQRRILNQIMEQTLEEIYAYFRQIYANHAGLVSFLHDIGMPVPSALRVPVERVVNAEIRELLEAANTDIEQLATLAEEAGSLDFELDASLLGLAAGNKVDALLTGLEARPLDADLLRKVTGTVAAIDRLPLQPDFWKAQNRYFAIHRRITEGETKNPPGDDWWKRFRKLGGLLHVDVS